MNITYPFSAVVGQHALKHALLLCAIDPAVGGVLVQGPRGVAKTTLARGLAALMPGTFVDLPLGATEDRITGTLDLDAALHERRVKFSPGLLARAHDGVLYLDEVNLLPDPLVDLLLDAAASGKNTVERDGVSHVHPARFVLIGTMNPDEGELRPQLIDRFGLSVQAESEIKPLERAQIITLRLEFDRDPEAFVGGFMAQQEALFERCQRARTLASRIPLSGPGLTRVTELCHAANVEGVRADLAMLRAARANAAWHGRDQITIEDVDAVAELALRHRRSPGDEPQRGSSGRGNPEGGTAPRGGQSAPSGGDCGGAQTKTPDTEASASGDRGALPPVPVRSSRPPSIPSGLIGARGQRESTRRYGAPHLVAARGRRGPRHAARGSIDWFATFACVARQLDPQASPASLDLRYRARRAAPEQLWILAIDCSTSMLRGGALSDAKGTAQAIEQHALRAGAQVALLSFRGSNAVTTFVSSAGRRTWAEAVSRLDVGGGTPLREALREVGALCKRAKFRARSVAKQLVLLTDGRSRETVTDLALERPELEVLVIDCERGNVRFNRARPLATELRGQYLHVDQLFARPSHASGDRRE